MTNGEDDKEKKALLTDELKSKILEALRSDEGDGVLMSQYFPTSGKVGRGFDAMHISRKAGLPASTVRYHLKDLNARGLVRSTSLGGRSLYFLTESGLECVGSIAQKGKVSVYMADRYQSGKNQVVLDNGLMEVVIAPEVGGRIIEYALKGSCNLLFRVYPDRRSYGSYYEYGGIEDTLGRWPGSVWGSPWHSEVLQQAGDKAVVKLWHDAGREIRLRMERTIFLERGSTTVQVNYKIVNDDERLVRTNWSNHPLIPVAHSTFYLIPSEGGLLSSEFQSGPRKEFIRPKEGWCAVAMPSHVCTLFQYFKVGEVDKVGVYSPASDGYPNRGTVELTIDDLRLLANDETSFTIFYEALKVADKESIANHGRDYCKALFN
jgi:DNA-binding transcriptional ArsR family regulator